MDVREFRDGDGPALRAFWGSCGISATALGCPKVNLIVWEDNTEAMDFWRAAGYAREKAVEFGKTL